MTRWSRWCRGQLRSQTKHGRLHYTANHRITKPRLTQYATGLATQLALAYAIHKSFIFIRVPLTAAVTPKVVKVLRSWGWQIGKRKPRKSKNKDQTKR